MKRKTKPPLRAVRREAWRALKRLGPPTGMRRRRIAWAAFNHTFSAPVKYRPERGLSRYVGEMLRAIRRTHR